MASPGMHDESDHFVRALSHDMSATFMLLEDSYGRLKRSLDEPSQTNRDQSVAHVDACLRELKRYLDDLAGLAKTGRVALEPCVVDVDAVVADVLFEQQEQIQARGARVHVRRPLPPVWCHPHRLKEIFSNLIRNALLHGCSPIDPTVTISADRVTDGDEVQRVALRVHDNGRGIESSLREEVFLPGRRLPGTSCEGSGMGLAIVRKAVEYYGGEVFVDPRCESGTAIVVCLPAPLLDCAGGNPTSEAGVATRRRDRNLETDPPHQSGDIHSHQSIQPLSRSTPRR